MQLSLIASLLLSLVSAGKYSNSESISIDKRYISKYNRYEPVVVYSTAKPTHNVLVGRTSKRQEISNSISWEGCRKQQKCKQVKKCKKKKCEKKKPKCEKKPKYSVSYSSTSWTSSSESNSSYSTRRHHRQRKVVVKKH